MRWLPCDLRRAPFPRQCDTSGCVDLAANFGRTKVFSASLPRECFSAQMLCVRTPQSGPTTRSCARLQHMALLPEWQSIDTKHAYLLTYTIIGGPTVLGAPCRFERERGCLLVVPHISGSETISRTVVKLFIAHVSRQYTG